MPDRARGVRRAKMCSAFRDLQKAAGVAQEHTVFLGAVVCAVAAGVLALVLFRTRRHARGRRGRGAPLRGLTPALGRTDPLASRGRVGDFDDLLAANRGVRRRLRPGRLRRHRARRRRHRDLHGLPDRPAAHGRPQAGRRQDLPQPRWPGHRRGARGAGPRRAPAQRRADPGRPPHPLRDDGQHPSRSCATRSSESAGMDADWQHVQRRRGPARPPSRRTSAKVRTHPLIPESVRGRRVHVRRRHRAARAARSSGSKLLRHDTGRTCACSNASCSSGHPRRVRRRRPARVTVGSSWSPARPGVGKSSLVEAFVRRTRRTPASPGAPATAPFTPSAARSAAGRRRPVGRRRAGRVRRRRTREARSRRCSSMLREHGDAGLSVLVIEDLHFADEATLDLLRHLARRLRARPCHRGRHLPRRRPRRATARCARPSATLSTLRSTRRIDAAAAHAGRRHRAEPRHRLTRPTPCTPSPAATRSS